MIVGIMGAKESEDMDFSYLKQEIYNLKDIPRPFNEELYRKYGVSDTVISHWKEIGFIPAYFHIFWLMREKKVLSYEEWIADKASLVEGIMQENKSVGEAVAGYCKAERAALDRMMTSDKDYIYLLKESFDDGSEDILILSSDMDVVMERMRDEITEDDDPYERDYYIERYCIDKSENGFLNIDPNQLYGRLTYNAKGVLTYMDYVEGFAYDGMGAIDLLEPYIFLPHPFQKGDAVSFPYGDETEYGILSYACDEDKTEEVMDPEKRNWDASDFTTTVETIFKAEDEDRFGIGHDHICPLYLDMAKTDWKNGDGPNPEMLHMMQQVMKGESDSLSTLSYFMG